MCAQLLRWARPTVRETSLNTTVAESYPRRSELKLNKNAVIFVTDRATSYGIFSYSF
jgi:hypothetical protein